MNKLIKALNIERRNKRNEFLKGINELTGTPTEVLNGSWYYRNLLPKGKDKSFFKDLSHLKTYLIDRYEKEATKQFNKVLECIKNASEAEAPDQIDISVEWKRSRTWGSNPTAEVKVSFKGGHCKYFKSSSISGCGYDKESTAIAQALNQSFEVKKLMYLFCENLSAKKITENHKLGYGSGYGILPRFEGGVGVSCYYRIFENMGFKFEKIAGGKHFDVYTAKKVKA